MKGKTQRVSHRSKVFQRKALALAIGSVALGIAGGAWAQATTGTIHGTVPVAPGETIRITGGAGLNRTITVGPSGEYSVTLPVGTYTVSLLQNGKVVQSRTDVTPTAAGSVNVSFSTTAAPSATQTLATVTVTANAIPAIDMGTTNQVTTFTHGQLNALPIARNAESIALLSPGVVSGATALGQGPNGNGFLAVGGASIAENAYFVDGMNTTDALTGQGAGIELPYGSIEQQQVYVADLPAKYGRAIGGVVNQIGRSGSNEWHFGFRAIWDPRPLQSNYNNIYWANPYYVASNPNLPPGFFAPGGGGNPTQQPGNLAQYRNDQKSWEAIYDAYVSGPIIPDKLFFFFSVEQDKTKGNYTFGVANPINDYYTQSQPKAYAKINWNINENNILSVSGVQNANRLWQQNYNFNYSNLTTGSFSNIPPVMKNKFTMWVANYTSFLTDNLTLNAMLGKMHGDYMTFQQAYPGFDPSLPNIISASNENPAYAPTPIINSNPTANTGSPAHRDTVMNYRLSLDWKLPWNLFGTHDISIGIDNMQTWDKNDGLIETGPGYSWVYSHGDPGKDIIASPSPSIPPFVGPPNSNPAGDTGYYVAQDIFQTASSIRVAQRAQYIQDRWQVTPDLLLSLGVRNDQFTNYNASGQPYINLHKPQWQPRLGFSWNALGDGSLKVFGNAGRYYLALPAEVALRGGGSASIFTNQYFTYTGIDANGIPQGLQPIPSNNGGRAGMGVSANNEYGQSLNPLQVAASNIEAEYSDNFQLGVQKKFQFLNTTWVAGATGQFNRLGRIIDDYDGMNQLCAAAIAQGVAYPGGIGQCAPLQLGFVLINDSAGPQDVYVADPNGVLHQIQLTKQDQGFQTGVKRNYYSLDLNLTHPFDGKWFGKADLIYSRSYGNTEGPVDSYIGQGGSSVSITEQWDFPQLMEYSDGTLPNSQKWQFILYGAYVINPEWQVGGTLLVGSGHPLTCLGKFGPQQTDPLGYGNAYHWCGGQPAPPGSTGYTPWTEQLNLNATYSPKFAEHRLHFTVQVFNVFNQQRTVQYQPFFGTTTNPDANYLLPFGLCNSAQTECIPPSPTVPPRFVRFSIAYDF